METARSDTGLLHLQWQHTVEPVLVTFNGQHLVEPILELHLMVAFSGAHLRVTFNGSIQWSPS